ncbi:putative leucine-rich repeat protein [Tanacetum coccineum]
MVSLNLHGCNFDGHIPISIDSFSNLTSLKFLHVSGNNFMNSPLVLKGLSRTVGSHLLLLDISSCGVSVQEWIRHSIGDVATSNEIVISELEKFTGFNQDSIGRLSSLRTFKIFENLISGPIPYSIGQLSSLEVLDLYSNRVNGSIPNSIGGLSSLEVLDLSYNRLNGSLPESGGQLSKLVHFDISNSFLSGVVTEAHFAKLGRLVFLGPRFPLWLQLQKDLVQLDISNTNISALVPESFWKSFPDLWSLDMSYNHIRGTLYGIVLPNLGRLDLCSNIFTGKLPDLFDSPLNFLDLSDNFFVGSLQHLLCPFNETGIDVLNLGNNHLSGIISECWDKWPGCTS